MPFAPTGTTGRTLAPPRRIETVIPPSGVEGIWVNCDATREFPSARRVAFDRAAFQKIGASVGFPLYQREGNPSTISIPVRSGQVAPSTRRMK